VAKSEEQLAREREQRRLERDRRRREHGLPTYFDRPFDVEALPSVEPWPGFTQPVDETTVALPQEVLRRRRGAQDHDAAPTPAAVEAVGTRGRLARSTAIFSLATGLSRLLGLVREIVAAYYFGASGKVNAFTVAFQVPNLVRTFVADAALSSAFVPVFSELLEKGDRKRAWRVASSLFWLLLLGLTALTAIFVLIAPWIIDIFGDPGRDRSLAVGLSRVLFPIVILLGISGVVVGILNSYDEFSVPALTPVFWNLVIIVGLAIGVPHADGSSSRLYVYAIAILVATLVQVFLPFPWLRGRDDRLRVLIDWHDPAVWRVLKLMVPVTLGIGLINVNTLVDTVFASRLIDPSLAPTAIQKAFQIYMFPQGMFSVAVATVLFPTLSRAATREDWEDFRHWVGEGLRQIGFLLVPASVAAAVLAEPIIRLVYQRGEFKPAQTPVVAGALAAFAAGLTFNGTMLMLNRAFFSLQENWIPTIVALANLGVNALLDLAFYRFGTWGIPLATAVVNVAGTAALVVLLRRRLGRIEGGRTTFAFTQFVVAGAALAAASYAVWRGLDDLLGRSFVAQLVSVGFGLAAGSAAYLVVCRALRVREMETLLSLRARFRRA
jgi:putative peptidoglycan lipid II flippase